MDEQDLGGVLERIVGRLESLERKVDELSPQPRALKFEEASQLLSCSLTVLKEMIRDGKLLTTAEPIGERKRIPMSEIARLTAVSRPPRTAAAPVDLDRRVQARSRAALKAEAEAVRALGKKFRR